MTQSGRTEILLAVRIRSRFIEISPDFRSLGAPIWVKSGVTLILVYGEEAWPQFGGS